MYEKFYREIHQDEEMYRKVERMLKALDRYKVFLAIEINMPKGCCLDVYVDNIPAPGLYKSLGFEEKLRETLGSVTL